LSYGVANTKGQVPQEQVEEMLDMARYAGIDTLDTAIAYGNAESVLGNLGVSDFRVISKLPSLCKSINSVDDWLMFQVEASISRLGVTQLAGLLLHSPDDLLGPHGEEIARGLYRARDIGLIERVGVSVYSPQQLIMVMNQIDLEMVQLPMNVFDRRFANAGLLDLLQSNDVEIHARSLFLQGLLLMPREHVPLYFTPFRFEIDELHSWFEQERLCGYSSIEACLAHGASYQSIDRMVVGADSPSHLQKIISASTVQPRTAPDSLMSISNPLINPVEWNIH
jgi:aryl-alcohol dehydrogenase-like predicted oxidoreductase